MVSLCRHAQIEGLLCAEDSSTTTRDRHGRARWGLLEEPDLPGTFSEVLVVALKFRLDS